MGVFATYSQGGIWGKIAVFGWYFWGGGGPSGCQLERRQNKDFVLEYSPMDLMPREEEPHIEMTVTEVPGQPWMEWLIKNLLAGLLIAMISNE